MKGDKMLEIPQCFKCIHYLEFVEPLHYRCDAFERIPLEIMNNDLSHEDPYPGDHGIRFEEKPKPGESPIV